MSVKYISALEINACVQPETLRRRRRNGVPFGIFPIFIKDLSGLKRH
jgi:hypothetical protein